MRGGTTLRIAKRNHSPKLIGNRKRSESALNYFLKSVNFASNPIKYKKRRESSKAINYS